jgi:hypothetical protein
MEINDGWGHTCSAVMTTLPLQKLLLQHRRSTAGSVARSCLARYGRTKDAIKLHLMLDHHGCLPGWACITEGEGQRQCGAIVTRSILVGLPRGDSLFFGSSAIRVDMFLFSLVRDTPPGVRLAPIRRRRPKPRQGCPGPRRPDGACSQVTLSAPRSRVGLLAIAAAAALPGPSARKSST